MPRPPAADGAAAGPRSTMAALLLTVAIVFVHSLVSAASAHIKAAESDSKLRLGPTQLHLSLDPT
eukprot:SAG11_NODE_37079_length_258_cov_1.025157_1_plen_64_part_01